MKLLHSLALASACLPAFALADTVPLPSSSQYWAYNSWYLENVVVDVLISGTEGGHIEQVLRELPRLTQKNVPVRRAVIIGGNSFTQLDATARGQEGERSLLRRISSDLKRQGKPFSASEFTSIQRRLGLSNTLRDTVLELGLISVGPVPRADELLAKFKVKQSPCWIVTYKGKQRLYQGVASIEGLFSNDGHFIGANPRMTRPEPSRAAPTFRTGAAIEYRLRKNEMQPGAGSYDVKPDCAAPNVREIPVLYDSEELSNFDLLFYNFRSDAQATQAQSWQKLAVPYLEGDLHNPYRSHRGLLQEYGRFFDIRCLPTRIHYFYRDGRRIEEYREGERAWDNP